MRGCSLRVVIGLMTSQSANVYKYGITDCVYLRLYSKQCIVDSSRMNCTFVHLSSGNKLSEAYSNKIEFEKAVYLNPIN